MVRGIRRTIGAGAKQKAPATAEILVAMLQHVPATLAGKRDRALLVLGFSGAFRRSELVGLDVADLVDDRDDSGFISAGPRPIRKGRGTRSQFRTAATFAPWRP